MRSIFIELVSSSCRNHWLLEIRAYRSNTDGASLSQDGGMGFVIGLGSNTSKAKLLCTVKLLPSDLACNQQFQEISPIYRSKLTPLPLLICWSKTEKTPCAIARIINDIEELLHQLHSYTITHCFGRRAKQQQTGLLTVFSGLIHCFYMMNSIDLIVELWQLNKIPFYCTK